jgi:Peptidase MA superfamily
MRTTRTSRVPVEIHPRRRLSTAWRRACVLTFWLGLWGWVGAPAPARAQSLQAVEEDLPVPQRGYQVRDVGAFSLEFMEVSAGNAQRVQGVFADASKAVEERLGLGLPGRPHAVLAPTNAEFARRFEALAGGPPPDHVLAVAFPAHNVLILREPGLRADHEANLYGTLRHELAHLALGPVEDARGERLPRWLNEGLAEWASGRLLTEEESLQVAGWAKFGDLPSLSEWAHTFPDHGQATARSYTVSLSFMVWVEHNGGVRRLVSELGAGESLDDAFRATTGYDAVDSELDWKVDLTESYELERSLLWSLNVWAVTAFLALLAIARHVWVSRRLKRQMQREDDAEDARSPDPDWDDWKQRPPESPDSLP